jgi:hypothetical protein
MTLLPDNILRRMSKSDRAAMGKSGRTMDEVTEQAEVRNEAQLQKQVRQLLNLNCCAVLQAPQGKASRMPAGWPDFTFSLNGQACAIECKTKTGVVSPDQDAMIRRMVQDRWQVCIARSLLDAANFVKQIKQQ